MTEIKLSENHTYKNLNEMYYEFMDKFKKVEKRITHCEEKQVNMIQQKMNLDETILSALNKRVDDVYQELQRAKISSPRQLTTFSTPSTDLNASRNNKEKDEALKTQMVKYEKAIQYLKNNESKYDELKT
jgi:hypothetical protein